MRNVCEWRLGRGELAPGHSAAGEPEPVSLDELVRCLKRGRSSVQRWTKQGGSQGYLRFVARYVG